MSAIDTAAKRAKLRTRKNPFWHGIGGGRGGVSLGYRKPADGAGTWVAKFVANGQRREAKIGIADDEPINVGALSFRDAISAVLEWGRQQQASIEVERANKQTKAPTVGLAIQEYIAGGKYPKRLQRYVLRDELAALQLARLSQQKMSEWRARLPTGLTAASRNRIVTDLRAALNAAAEKYRRMVPAFLQAEIRVGTKAEMDEALPRHQLLTDEQIRRAVDTAFDDEVDPSGDFGRLILMKAVTGARFSQIARLKVKDVQTQKSRVMMPGSRKGRNRKPKPPVAIPVTSDVIIRLKPALQQRSPEEPLLMRWGYRQRHGVVGWVKDKRQPWQFAYEASDFWPSVRERAKLPADTIMYAFRHSSIVRMLLANLPVRLVAAQHDTSIEMIERHYAAYISDMSEDLARRSMMQLAGPSAVPDEAANERAGLHRNRESEYRQRQLRRQRNGKNRQANAKRKAPRATAKKSIGRSA